MKSEVSIALSPTPAQAQRLRELQARFAEVCNALAPTVRDRRCWNRVTLHHLSYRALREQFPDMGSQMVCNAIYAICRAARGVFQRPDSPFHLSRLKGDRLPLLQFAADCPVFFDRHTLSLKDDTLSMYTLDGRMRFQLRLNPELVQRFREERVREILLSQTRGDNFELVFLFANDANDADEEADAPAAAEADPSPTEIPPYLKVEEAN